MLEILAPCGSEESLTAALNSGADAVYLGLESFSARRNATNFTEQQFRDAVLLCHRSGVRVYVTMNTLVRDDELPELEKAVTTALSGGADALIVQDYAVAQLARKISPDAVLHASTQMTVTSVAGAEYARKQGFSRVVLARELSLEQIEEIIKKVDIQTEVFVHGALCVCLSGQCYMSAMLGGRSGNRGLCAQPCRLNFTHGKRENVLSLKDLSIIERLSELEKIGVSSAKIEGRMKRPEYVAAVVSECRKSLAGEKPDIELLRSVFSRSGFTDAYFTGSLNGMQGVRTKEDVVASPKTFAKLHELYKAPYKRFTVEFEAFVEEGIPIRLRVTADGLTAEVTGQPPEKALSRATTSQEISDRLKKLGGTVFSAGSVTVSCGEGLSVSASSLNELRRNALSELSELIAKDL